MPVGIANRPTPKIADNDPKNLPKDDSGIDITEIWQIIRQKIIGAPGFEVVEDLYRAMEQKFLAYKLII